MRTPLSLVRSTLIALAVAVAPVARAEAPADMAARADAELDTARQMRDTPTDDPAARDASVAVLWQDALRLYDAAGATLDTPTDRRHLAVGRARAHVLAGDTLAALEALQQAVDATPLPADFLPALRADAWFAPLVDDPRFDALVTAAAERRAQRIRDEAVALLSPEASAPVPKRLAAVDGKSLSTRKLRGAPAALYVWAPGTLSSRDQFPTVFACAEATRDQAAWLALAYLGTEGPSTTRARIRRFEDKYDLPIALPQLLVSVSAVEQMGVVDVPSLVIVDADGGVRAVLEKDWDAELVQRALVWLATGS
ncbi:MAG: hypothetical protein H6733_06755 [Alphaproteobacteria bacterium]|nr:hypothetical protein [Alphaproteobacteria bacterium]